MEKEAKGTILFLGTFPPRECGIATFTNDLTNSINKRISHLMDCKIAAMNSNGVNIYNYPNKVIHEISDTDLNDYIEIAKKINSSSEVKLICIQHEFGIFGGEWGDYLLPFLELLQKPVITTFHSILPKPNEKLKKVVQAIAERVKGIIVMTEKGIKILREVYSVETPIYLIPHGIPTTNFESQDREKANLGLEGKTILSSFGMVSPGKGYEKVIESLTAVIKKFPNILYLIIGETHPIIRKNEGEEYRNYLTRRIKNLKLENNVKFYNKYLTLKEIIRYLKATDIYMSSSENPNQITSGTLVYAMGCGRAVISTPFLHAKDIVNEERGILTKFNDIESFEQAIIKILENPELKKSMEKNSYFFTREMTWPNVALRYCEIFKQFTDLHSKEIEALPEINISHFLKLTNKFGIIQFADQKTPDLESGYTLDDNARALLVSTKLYEKFKEYEYLSLIKTYLDYIQYVQTKDGKLYNLVNKKKEIDKFNWSEDAQGRALWALGFLTSSPNIPENFKRKAENILLKTISQECEIKSSRATAFTIQGLYYYNKIKNSKEIENTILRLSNKLCELYKNNSKEEWKWFESSLTYGNSKLSEALFYSYLATKEKKYLDIAEESLNFLISKTFPDNIFIPIGQRGWFPMGGTRAYHDQQPIEAAYTIQALLLANKITGKNIYRKLALQSFQWFLGKNSLNQVIYNENTGGCHDGLGEKSINLNQGAESTISYLLARLAIAEI
ncbi:MAG: glycosyltransferase [archaeon]